MVSINILRSLKWHLLTLKRVEVAKCMTVVNVGLVGENNIGIWFLY